MQRRLSFAIASCALLLLGCASPGIPKLADRVILFIGDGMGPSQMVAGEYYLGRPLSFSGFEVHSSLTTRSADNAVTDSAASATAIATGFKVGNGVLSLELPGAGRPLETILEKAKAAGKSTGLVTTVYVTHATPAAFAAHQPHRTLYDAIADDYLLHSRPNVLLGGGANGLDDDEAIAAGYRLVKTLSELEEVPAAAEPFVAGLFGTGFLAYEADGGPHSNGHPDLADMTTHALRLLENDQDGFFLMVESGLIDQAAHINDAGRMVGEVAALDRAVTAALVWAAGKDDVLIIVTADHESGGISGVVDQGAGNVPTVTWSTTGHTNRPVDLFASGAGAERLSYATDNTLVFALSDH